MATYNAGAGRGKQGGPTAEELNTPADESAWPMTPKQANAILKGQRDYDRRTYGGKVYMGDANAKPATQQELDDFENNTIDKKTNPLIAITNKVGPAVERGLDTALPLRKFANMAVAATTANISKKQYDDQVAAFETLPKEEQDRDRLKTRIIKPMKHGGTASSRADGIAQRGKTRGNLV